MPVAKLIANRPKDRLTGASCRREDVNPNWWTDVHETQSHQDCRHALARHICLVHCPVLAACAEDAPRWETDWAGMVVAGELKSVRYGKPITAHNQPHGYGYCPFCVPAS